MRKILFLALLISTSSFAQIGVHKTPYTITKKATVYPRTMVNTYDARAYSVEAPFPGGDGYKDFLLRQKLKVAKDFPRVESSSRYTSRSSEKPPVVIDTMGLYWNHPQGDRLIQGGTPNDNSMAASDKYMIVAWNSAIYYHDLQADTAMINPPIGFTYISFRDFASPLRIDSDFDPKILWDPDSKRFILMFLSVDRNDRPNTSKTVIGFSTTENPLDPWNLYEIDGNPLKNGWWSDYPQIALSENELFFTINLLNGGDWVRDFERTIIWQFDKNSGYRGDSVLTTELWDSVYFDGKPVRYLHPVQYAYPDNRQNMYFVSNNAIPVNPSDTVTYSYDSLFVVNITNTIASGNAKMEIEGIRVNTRMHTSPLARQPGSGEPLWTNDSRILGAHWYSDAIQVVGNSVDTTNGNSGVFHGIIDISQSPMTAKVNIISDPNFDIGYPNMVYTGYGAVDQSTLIAFNHSGPNDFPGFSCMYYNGDNSGSTDDYSPIVKVIEGQNFLNTFQTGSERWGDYFGIQRIHTSVNQAWLSGYFVKPDNNPSVYVAKVQTPNGPVSAEQLESKTMTIEVFPNPTSDRFTISFDLSEDDKVEFRLYDTQGKLVTVLLKESLKAGKNEFSFSTHSLEQGLYILDISSKSKKLGQHRVVVK